MRRDHSPRAFRVCLIACSFSCAWWIAGAAFADDWIWTGNMGNWSKASNWNVNGEVATTAPNSSSNVYIDDGSRNISKVTVDITHAAANSLTLDADDALLLNPTASLTVGSSGTLNGVVGVGQGRLVLNGPVTNNALTPLNGIGTLAGLTVSGGTITGSGTLTNSSNAVVSGSGTISVASIVNSGDMLASGANPLVFSGTSITNIGNAQIAGDSLLSSFIGGPGSLVFKNSTVGGGFLGGTMLLNNATLNGTSVEGTVTAENGSSLNGGALGWAPGFGGNAGTTFTDGSSLRLTGSVTNPTDAELVLGSGSGTGVTIAGNGNLDNEFAIYGTGRITPNITNNGSIYAGVVPSEIGGFGLLLQGSGTLSFGGTVNNAGGGGINIAAGAAVDLNGALVVGGQIVPGANFSDGQQTLTGSVLSAENGAALRNVTLNPVMGFGFAAPTLLTVTDGSALGIQGTVTVGDSVTLALGRGGFAGATLNGQDYVVSGPISVLFLPQLVNDGTIQGNGNLNVPIQNNGAIIARLGTLSLSGSVSNPNDLSTLQSLDSGDLEINRVTVHAESVSIAPGSMLSGIGTIKIDGLAGDVYSDRGVVAPGLTAKNFLPGVLTINGSYFQHQGSLLINLDGDKAGQYSQLDVTNGFAILEPGDSVLATFGHDFNPLAACLDVTGICATFDILSGDISGVSDASQLQFYLPSVAGLSWQESLTSDELLLELMGGGESGGGSSGGGSSGGGSSGGGSSGGGSSGGGSSGGGSSGGGTSVPEPGALALLAAGLVAVMSSRARRRDLRRAPFEGETLKL